MITATKTVRFDAAHVLTNHLGLCRNLHGHTYRVEVSVRQGDALPEDGASAGMVIDFKDLKSAIEESVVSRFDHSFIYNENSPAESEIAGVVAKHGMRTVALPCRSTAENLAHHFFCEIAAKVAGVCSVKVWETPDSCAEYRKEN